MDDHLPEPVQYHQSPSHQQSHSYQAVEQKSPFTDISTRTVPPYVNTREKGLQRIVWILAILLVAVVLAAVGAGVGGGLSAVNKAKSDCDPNLSSSGSTSSSSSSSSPDPASCSATETATVTRTETETATATETTTATQTVTSSDSPAPQATLNNYTPPIAGTLAVDCDAISQNTQTISIGDIDYKFFPRCNYDYPSNDLMTIISYSFDDCMAACAQYNDLQSSSSSSTTPCALVAFIAYIFPFPGANCFLKGAAQNGLEKDPNGVTYVVAPVETS